MRSVTPMCGPETENGPIRFQSITGSRRSDTLITIISTCECCRQRVSSRQACWINGIDGLASVRRIFVYLNVYSKVLRDIWILVPGLAQCYMASEDLKGGKLPPHPFTVMPATPNIWMPHPPQTCAPPPLARIIFFLSYPTHPNLWTLRADAGAKPTSNIDLICVKIGAALSAQSRRPFSSLNSPFT